MTLVANFHLPFSLSTTTRLTTTTTTTMSALTNPQNYDRTKDLQLFEASKSGVKGLIDSGTSTVPQIFIRPPDEIADDSIPVLDSNLHVPVIDLTGIQSPGHRQRIVDEVKQASKEWGFFLVVNHGIAVSILEGMLEGIRRFHELDVEVKKRFNDKDMRKKVKFGSNVDLHRSRSANWRDTLTISLTMSDRLEPDELPEVCRDSTIEYIDQVTKLSQTLFELLSEALGLKSDYLGNLECYKARLFVCHYYPPCPEPELTMGTRKHTDPSILTILLQDQIGGLQVLHDSHYVNVPPLAGSLVVNIGNMLQIMTNDEFISTDHRVVANRVGPRISVAGFFNGSLVPGQVYGPIKELISEDRPPRYKDFTVREYITKFLGRALDKSGLDDFRLQE